MLNLLIKVILINLAAALIVFILSNYVEAFHTTRLSDFLFFVVIVIWGIAKLLLVEYVKCTLRMSHGTTMSI